VTVKFLGMGYKQPPLLLLAAVAGPAVDRLAALTADCVFAQDKPVQVEKWRFTSDLSARRRFFHESAFSHPAKLHLGLLQRLIDLYTEPGQTILDPMAGTGSLMIAATQMRNVILRDLEPAYVDLMLCSLPIIRREAGLFAGLIDLGQGDAKTLDCPPFDHVITSPPYGFGEGGRHPEKLAERAARLAKVHHGHRWDKFLSEPTHASFASSFHYAGGNKNTGNKSGRSYLNDMRQIYERCAMFLPPHGKLILILKNHYRRGELKDVTSQTITVVESLGLRLVARHGRYIDNPSLWQRRRREQGLPIVDIEDVMVFAAP
jgi:DNA modification methylase